MGVQLSASGDTTQDISDIIDTFNTLNDTSSITNALTINAYGQFLMSVPDLPNETTISKFLHNLGYPPMFMVKIQAVDGGFFDLPVVVASYFYSSGTKSQGEYPYCIINCYSDNQYLNVSFNNVANPGGFIQSGTFTFSYYIFSRPIHA